MKGSRFIVGLFLLLAALGAWLAWMTKGALERRAAQTAPAGAPPGE